MVSCWPHFLTICVWPNESKTEMYLTILTNLICLKCFALFLYFSFIFLLIWFLFELEFFKLNVIKMMVFVWFKALLKTPIKYLTWSLVSQKSILLLMAFADIGFIYLWHQIRQSKKNLSEKNGSAFWSEISFCGDYWSEKRDSTFSIRPYKASKGEN